MSDDTGPELDIELSNYPPSGSDGQIRQIMFGPVGPMTLLIQVDGEENESGELAEAKITITLSNATEHEGVPDFLRGMAEMLNTIADAPGTVSSLEAAIASHDAQLEDDEEDDL